MVRLVSKSTCATKITEQSSTPVMDAAATVRYIHRTVPVASAPPPRADNDESTMSASEPKERRVKKLTSILPDTLDVIAESSEHSEYSSPSLHEVEEQVSRSPQQKGSIPKGSSKPSSPHRSKSKSTSREALAASSRLPQLHSDSDDEREVTTPPRAVRKTGAARTVSHRSPHKLHEESENDSTGATDKLTQSESEGADDDDQDYEDESSYELSEEGAVEDEGNRKQATLFSYLQKSTRNQNISASEQQSFDENNSVMKFDYDGDDNDDGDFSCSRQSLASTCIGGDDDELTWRSDPTQSLSDWTITVINTGTQTAEHYHVHKNMLAVGKRKSEFFANVFQEQRKSAKRSNVTELRLPSTAANMIPMLLDYVYAGDKALMLSSETAPGMRYLSQYFGMRTLFERIMKFIQKDLSLKTLVAYYKGSTDLCDQKVLGICARHTARNIHLIDISHNLVEVMDPAFFYSVISSPGLEGTEKKIHLSLLIAKYCQLNKDTLDGETFLKLTTEEYLPQIHHSASLCLLEMEADLVIATSLKSMMSMTSLQQRCIQALSSHWREFAELEPTRTALICRKLPAIVVTELMLRTMDTAKNDAQQTTTRVLVKRNGTQKNKLMNETVPKAEFEATVAKLKDEFEQKVSHLQALCYEKDKHIKNYYEELARFQRVPIAPEGKLVSSARGLKPTTMPALGKHTTDGYLLTNKKKGGPVYPVFYFKGEGNEE